MELFTRDDLRSLLTVQDPNCITITLPADPAHPQAGPISLKNLHREAARLLETRGLKPQEAASLLEPVEKLIADPLYWREQSGGLAIFLAGDFFQTFRVSIPLDERASVRDRFMFSPLIPLLAGDGLFYVLTLTQKGVRLLEGRRASLSEVHGEGLPDAADESLGHDHRQRGSSVNAYGSGPEEDDHAQIARFFREVDKVLGPYLKRSCAPLVLAGVEHIQAIYRAANTYPQLVDGGIAGSPEPLRPADLQPKAWAVVRPFFEREQQAAVGQFEQLARTERASSDPRSIVPAAHYGRIETLFVARAHQPGRFDASTGKVTLHKSDQPDAEDLLDLAAIQTIQNDGRVFSIAQEDIPGKSVLAAVYRY